MEVWLSTKTEQNTDNANVDIPLNQAQYVWFGPYDVGQEFTSLYRVTVPNGADLGTHTFDGQLGYKIASDARLFKDIGGDSVTNVIVADSSATATPTPSPTPTPALTPAPPGTWSFCNPGFFPKHMPDSYTGEVVLGDLNPTTIPPEVQGVYWYDCSTSEWKFWAPGAPGTTLMSLGGGHTYDYMVSVTGSCDWEVPLP